MRLGEAELRPGSLHLGDPLREVLTDGQAGDVIPRVLAKDAVPPAADRHDELDLPVDAALGQVHRRLRTREARRGTS